MKAKCEQCGGTGWLIRKVEGGGAQRAYAERCPCIAQETVKHRWATAGIPAKYADTSFAGFAPSDVSQRAAFEACRRLVERYPQAPKGLLLMGPPGVGKTHLAISTFKELLLKGALGVFYDFRELLDELRSSYDENAAATESSIFERVTRIDVLVLDELGSEKLTDWVREVMHRLVIRRYNEQKLTILTTNYLDAELVQDEKSDPLSNLQGRIGYRLRSRLYEMCDTLVLAGSDHRRQQSSLDKVRASAPTAAAQEKLEEAVEPMDEDLAKCFEALSKKPQHLQNEWYDKALKALGLNSRMHSRNPAVQRKAAEFYQEFLQGKGSNS